MRPGKGFGDERRSRRSRRQRQVRAVYLLPNLITSASLLLGFWSMVLGIHGQYERAALFIILAGVFDTLDGRVARATHSTSRFGVEYDSIADMVSFGIAPALLIYNWALVPLGNRGWLIAALFALCAALRLARFNIQVENPKRTHYTGIPSTMAGGIVASTVLFVSWLEIDPQATRAVGIAISSGFAVLALLMVSSIPYPSWKSLHVPRRHAYTTLVGLVLAGVALLLHYEWLLFAISLCFIVSGPLLWLAERRKEPVDEVSVSPTIEEPSTENPRDV